MELPGPTNRSDFSILPREADDSLAQRVWGLIWRHYRLVAAVFVVAVAIAASAAWLATPTFESTLMLRVDDRDAGPPVLKSISALTDNSSGQISTEIQTLRSRSLAEATVDSLALHLRARVPRRMFGMAIPRLYRRLPRSEVIEVAHVARAVAPRSFVATARADGRYDVVEPRSGRVVATATPGQLFWIEDSQITLALAIKKYPSVLISFIPFENAVEGVRAKLRVIRPMREANLVSLVYEHEDSVIAAQVPNIITKNFLVDRTRIQKTAARSTVAFLRQQIDTLAIRLGGSEESIRSFREGNRVVSLPEQANVQVSELAKLQAERNSKEGERLALSRALDEARSRSVRSGADSGSSPFRSLLAFPTLLNTNAAQFSQALNDAENQRAMLLQRRTAQDKDVLVLTSRIHQLERQVSSVAQTYLDGLTSQINSMDATLARFSTDLTKIPSKELELARLDRQSKVLVDIYTLLQTRLQEARIEEAVEDSKARVIDAALVPMVPVRPRRGQYLFIGALLGLILGISAAFASEALDRTVHTREDVTLSTGSPTLGLIPFISMSVATSQVGAETLKKLPQRARRLVGTHIAAQDPRHPVAEAYRTLRTNITFARPESGVHVLVVSSPTPGDGKTTTAANLASILAHQGGRVLLVDADMRTGTLSRTFSIPREPGLSNLLIGQTTVPECIHTVKLEGLGAFDVISAGTFPPNPAELIGSTRMQQVLSETRELYDFIIFDTPPLNLVTDAAVLGRQADGVILVARAGKTHKAALGYSVELLQKVRAPLLGTVLNGFVLERDGRYSGYAGYAYYQSAHYLYYEQAQNGSRQKTKV